MHVQSIPGNQHIKYERSKHVQRTIYFTIYQLTVILTDYLFTMSPTFLETENNTGNQYTQHERSKSIWGKQTIYFTIYQVSVILTDYLFTPILFLELKT